MGEIKYIYIRNNSNINRNDNGVICAGYVIKYNVIQVAFSFCRKGDRFSKKIAHRSIRKRLIANKFEIKYNSVNFKYPDVVTLVKQILYGSSIIKDSNNKYTINGCTIPSWCRKYAICNYCDPIPKKNKELFILSKSIIDMVSIALENASPVFSRENLTSSIYRRLLKYI